MVGELPWLIYCKKMDVFLFSSLNLGSISAALSSPVFVPP